MEALASTGQGRGRPRGRRLKGDILTVRAANSLSLLLCQSASDIEWPAQLLDELSAQTRIPKAVLLREAVDDLLMKHGKLKPPPRSKSKSGS
jgi:hypothetical protein